MNERSFIVKSLYGFLNSGGSRGGDPKAGGWRTFPLRTPDLIPTLLDDATYGEPGVVGKFLYRSAADLVAGKTARSKQSRSNRKARKRQFP